MLATRIVTALVALPLAVAGILFLPTAAVALIFALFMLVGAWEWGGLLRLTGARRFAVVGPVLLIIALTAGSSASPLGTGGALIIGLACLWWLIALYWIARFPVGWAPVMGRIDLGVIAGVLSLAAPVAAVANLHSGAHGPLLLLILFVIVWAADTGAYFAGRACGRHKLAPNVSPGKTREGAIGGLIVAILVAGGGAWVLGYPGSRTLAFMLLGGWVAFMSIVGDLTISMFKRHAGLKDSGSLFPGHGGVLDRLDSVLAAAPWFVVGLHWLLAQF